MLYGPPQDPEAPSRPSTYGTGAEADPDHRAVTAGAELAAVTLSAYDPAFDLTGGVRETAIAALRLVAGTGAPPD